MTLQDATINATVLSVRCEQQTFPPYDAFHATPNPMLYRRLVIETARGNAVFEQTDYGHPGKLNAWEPRGIAPALLPKVADLMKLAGLLEALL